MRLPGDLSQAIELEIQKVERGRLATAAAQLIAQYQAGVFCAPVMNTRELRAAYLAVRVPVTFAANARVFAEVHRLAPQAEPRSILDVGAGPGTSLHAAIRQFPSLQKATGMEADASLIELGSQIAAHSSEAAIQNTRWLRHDLRSGLACERHDLVVISYALGELPPPVAENAVLQAWETARQFLVIVEPGTVKGFGVVNAARSLLIRTGAHLLAPCPHADGCPMAATGDWCHFSVRLERTSFHRQLKGGTLGYEDEKFSYLAASREAFPRPGSRIVRHPQKYSGHVQLVLCTPQGLDRRTISRSQKQDYKDARKAAWGDPWTP